MKAVALVSGGMDSTGFASQYAARGYEIHPLIFRYGQKGWREVEVALSLCRRLGFREPVVVGMEFMRELWRGTQLTDEGVEVRGEYRPDVVVPLRNAVFLTLASAYAHTVGAERVLYGATLSDTEVDAGTGWVKYPDTTPLFSSLLSGALAVGHFNRLVEITSPAQEGMDKVECLRRSFRTMGPLIYETWSCYLSGRVHCGRCESCLNRREAFRRAGIEDRTEYELSP
ncbi:MAG: 7-cyano-7-deazaguanine synthase [Candidatus Hadarchaeales archaeon]